MKLYCSLDCFAWAQAKEMYARGAFVDLTKMAEDLGVEMFDRLDDSQRFDTVNEHKDRLLYLGTFKNEIEIVTGAEVHIAEFNELHWRFLVIKFKEGDAYQPVKLSQLRAHVLLQVP